MRIVSIIMLLLAWESIFPQTSHIKDMCLSKDEIRLAELIQNFRIENGLPEIALSISLSYVAKNHVFDLQINNPDTSICTTASWSNKGTWKACCINKYIFNPNCTWDKPKEITDYKYKGYEISYFEESILNPDSVFKIWKTSLDVTDMILSKNKHSDKKWLAMGVGMSDNYASIWFGQRLDPKGKPNLCQEKHTRPFLADFRENQKVEESKYYLIFGAFEHKSDAMEAVKRFKNTGFTNAQVLLKDNKIRVALAVFNTIEEAAAFQEHYRSSFSDAWIYKD